MRVAPRHVVVVRDPPGSSRSAGTRGASPPSTAADVERDAAVVEPRRRGRRRAGAADGGLRLAPPRRSRRRAAGTRRRSRSAPASNQAVCASTGGSGIRSYFVTWSSLIPPSAQRPRAARPSRSCRRSRAAARGARPAARGTSPGRAPGASRWATSSGRLRLWPGFSSTYTHTRSPKIGSGIATAAARATAGCVATSASTSAALTFLPPRMMKSALRPTTRSTPSPSSSAMSPGQHPAVRRCRACGSPRGRSSSRGSWRGRGSRAGRAPLAVTSRPASSKSRTCISGITWPALRSRSSRRVARGGARERAGLVRAVELEHAAPVASSKRAALLVGHRLAAGEEHAQRGEVRLARARVLQRLEHQDELGAHGGEHGHAVALDGAQRRLGVEARREHGRRAEQASASRGRSRCRSRRASAAPRRTRPRARELARRDGQLVEGEPAALVVDHALREPRRARGRVQQEELVGGEGALGRRRPARFDGGAAEEQARAPPSSSPSTTRWCASAAPSRRRSATKAREVDAPVLLAAHEGPRARRLEQMAQLPQAGARPDPHHDEAGLLAADVDGVHAGAVGQPDGDTLAARETGPRSAWAIRSERRA